MSKNSPISLKQIISRLSADEKAILSDYLKGFHSQYGNYESKYYQLYQAISDISGDPNIEELREKISPNSSLDAFQKLCARLKDKILDSLILDFNVLRPGKQSKSAQRQLQLRKLLPQLQVLYSKGLLDEVRRLGSEGYQEANKYCFYYESSGLLQLLYALECRLGQKKKIAELKSIMDRVIELRAVTEKAEHHFTSLVYREYYEANLDSFSSELFEKISELEKIGALNDSPLARYYYMHLKALWHKSRKEYPLVEFFAREIVHLLVQNEPLRSGPRTINGYLQLTEACVHNHQFSKGLEYIDKALVEIPPKHANRYDVEAQKFLIHIYNGETRESESMLDLLKKLADTSKNIDKVPLAKFDFYKANLQFINGQFANASKTLRTAISFKNDREGWNISFRILQIMAMIENRQFDEADQEIENFRKTLSNLMKVHPVSKRNIMIFRVLTWLSKKDFDFGRVNKEHNKLLSLLASSDPDLRWDFLTPEIIPFHRWFTAKSNKEELNPAALYSKAEQVTPEVASTQSEQPVTVSN